MKRFIGFVIKEFYHIFRDKRTLIVLFGMPVVQILLFGFAITNEIKNVNVAIFDKSKDEITKQISNKIISSGFFIRQQNIEKSDEIEEAFKSGKVKAVIVFEPHFAQNLKKEHKATIQILADATNPNVASTVSNYVTAIVNNYTASYNKSSKIPYLITPEVKMFYNPSLKSVFMFVPGVMTIILMLVSAMMTSISITREKELGTMEVLLVSPLKPIQVIIGKVVPYLLLSVINAFVIIVLGASVFGMPISGNLLLLAAETTLFVITALALGILISTLSNSQQTAMMISLMALMLPTILLSGFIFPISSMPVVLQWISNIIPAKWFIIIIKGVMLKGVGIQYVWKETLVLSAMTLFFILVSVKKYKIRL